MKNLKRAVFLDRDDTIIRNVPYLGDPEKVQLLPTTREALQKLVQAGFSLCLVSNQSGVGRGLITEEQVAAVNARMVAEIGLGEDLFLGSYMCYTSPLDPNGPGDRKPSPSMLFEARDSHHFELEHSFMVGDKLIDVQCGHNAGCKSALILAGAPGESQDRAKKVADFFAETLEEIADWIVEESKEV